PPKVTLPGRFLLFVGQRGRYKNFSFLVEALSAIAADYPDIHLVCTWQSFDRQEQEHFKSKGLADRIHYVQASDAELAYLYRHAACFVFPTLYEGCGMPVLEAFQQDCPVLLSNTSSFPEVGGDAVIYFDPKDTGSLLSALRRILDHGDTL